MEKKVRFLTDLTNRLDMESYEAQAREEHKKKLKSQQELIISSQEKELKVKIQELETKYKDINIDLICSFLLDKEVTEFEVLKHFSEPELSILKNKRDEIQWNIELASENYENEKREKVTKKLIDQLNSIFGKERADRLGKVFFETYSPKKKKQNTIEKDGLANLLYRENEVVDCFIKGAQEILNDVELDSSNIDDFKALQDELGELQIEFNNYISLLSENITILNQGSLI